MGVVPRAAEADVDAAVTAARAALDAPDGWRTWTAERRRDALEAFAVELGKRGAGTARRVTLETGMPAGVAGVFEAMFPAVLMRYYGGLMVDHPTEERRPGMTGGETLVTRERRGGPSAAPAPSCSARSPWSPVTLELGGRSAAVVLDDADLAARAESFSPRRCSTTAGSAG